MVVWMHSCILDLAFELPNDSMRSSRNLDSEMALIFKCKFPWIPLPLYLIPLLLYLIHCMHYLNL